MNTTARVGPTSAINAKKTRNAAAVHTRANVSTDSNGFAPT